MRKYGITNAVPYGSAPTVGPAGDMYFNTLNKSLYVSDGNNWQPVQLSSSGGTGPIWANFHANTTTTSSTAPGAQIGLLADENSGGGEVVIQSGNVLSFTRAGAYLVTANVTVQGGASIWNTLTMRYFRSSDAQTFDKKVVGETNVASGFDEISMAVHINAGVGDQVYFFMQCQSGTTTVDARSWFTVTGVTATGIQGPTGPSGGVPIYANAAARDAAIPSPTEGMLAMLTSPSSMTQYHSAVPQGWFPPWNLPWGEVAAVQLANDSAAITANVETTILEITNFVFRGGRKYDIRAHVAWSNSVTTSRNLCRIYNITDVDRVTIFDTLCQIANLVTSMTAVYRLTPATDLTKTFRITAQNAGAAGNLIIRGPSATTLLAIHDVGPQ